MRTAAMEALQIVLMVAVCLLQCPSGGDCLDFAERFNQLAAFASNNGGYDNPEAMRRLEELKTEMMQACRDGALKEVRGYWGISQVGGTATKAYYYHVKHSTEKENHVLPDVDCRQIESKPEAYYDDLDKSRVTPLKDQRTTPGLPTYQNQRTMQSTPFWWLRFASRYESIKMDAIKNDGYLTRESSDNIELLKQDITSACRLGHMKIVGPGQDIKGVLNEVTIPTKVYALTTLPYPEEQILPDTDCRTDSAGLPTDYDSGRGSSLGERINPVYTNPYDSPRRISSLPRSTSLNEDDMRRHGLLRQDSFDGF